MRFLEDKQNKKLAMILCIPLILVAQYYLFKFGILKPMIKGVDINIINGEYIQDIDKYVVRLGEEVTLSSGEYIKVPKYAKNPEISFKVLDNSKVLKVIENEEDNTAILVGLKTGYSSIAVVKNSAIIKKASVLVVDPKVESLDLNIDGNLVFVGDKANLESSIEVDYKRFKDVYDVSYESSNENVLKVEGNEIKAVGVGQATVYAKSGDKVDSIKYNINARVESINVDELIELEVGQSKKINPKIITSPKNLKHPKIEYQLLESKLPIERVIRLDNNGNIVALREGEEKVLVSCGIGSNKKSQIITVKVNEESILNNIIEDLVASYEIIEGKMIITLNWSSIPEIYNYDVYLKNNSLGDKEYKVQKSIIMDKIDLDNDNKIKCKLELDIKDLKEVNLSMYVVGLTENGKTKNSNIVNIKHKVDEEQNEELILSASIDEEAKKINLSWNSISNSTYNVYIKDISNQSEEFVLYEQGLTQTNTSINIDTEELNLEVYVVALSDGKEKAKSDIKVFK